MISVITWNARGINTQGVIERLKSIKSIYQLFMIAILEPFSNSSHIDSFKQHLTMDEATSNINGKICPFWNHDVDCQVLEADEQHITCEIKHVQLSSHFTVTFMYTKCRDYLRRPLWDRLLHYSDINSESPWCTIEDFNVITA